MYFVAYFICRWRYTLAFQMGLSSSLASRECRVREVALCCEYHDCHYSILCIMLCHLGDCVVLPLLRSLSCRLVIEVGKYT